MFANVHWKRLECKVKALCADTQTKTLTARKALLENTVMLLPEIFNLGSAYKNYFELVPAVSEILRDEVYRIRHQVYCEELAFEPQRPDRREKDVYDAHSLHLLIRTVQTGNFAGCVRQQAMSVRPTVCSNTCTTRESFSIAKACSATRLCSTKAGHYSRSIRRSCTPHTCDAPGL